MRLVVEDMSQGHVGWGGGAKLSQGMHEGMCQTRIATSSSELKTNE